MSQSQSHSKMMLVPFRDLVRQEHDGWGGLLELYHCPPLAHVLKQIAKLKNEGACFALHIPEMPIAEAVKWLSRHGCLGYFSCFVFKPFSSIEFTLFEPKH